MKPGQTIRPAASISVSAVSSERSPTAAIRSPSIATVGAESHPVRAVDHLAGADDDAVLRHGRLPFAARG